MCICLLLLRPSSRFPFICCHNRDEDPARGSGTCGIEKPNGDQRQFLCSRDLLRGGMVSGLHWKVDSSRDSEIVGFSEESFPSWAVLTNCRTRWTYETEENEEKPSRGKLVEELLKTPKDSSEHRMGGADPPDVSSHDACHACWGRIGTSKPHVRWLSRYCTRPIDINGHKDVKSDGNEDGNSAVNHHAYDPHIPTRRNIPTSENWKTEIGELPEDEVIVFSNAISAVPEHSKQWKKCARLKQQVERNIPERKQACSTALDRSVLFDFLVGVMSSGEDVFKQDDSDSTQNERNSDFCSPYPTPADCAHLDYSYSNLPPHLEHHLSQRIRVDSHPDFSYGTVSQIICISDAEDQAVYWWFRERDQKEFEPFDGDRLFREPRGWHPWQEFRVPWGGTGAQEKRARMDSKL